MGSIEQAAPKTASVWPRSWAGGAWVPSLSPADGERSARATLRAQVARLEHELSALVASAFPHVRPLDGPVFAAPSAGQRGHATAPGVCSPRLLGLGELERSRDELAARLQRARAKAGERAALAERSAALLEEMRRDPRGHRFARLKVADLGEGSCGFWEVRPRLGLIGMLAGWWEVKLSSGCP
jgi:hypothetical protein